MFFLLVPASNVCYYCDEHAGVGHASIEIYDSKNSVNNENSEP